MIKKVDISNFGLFKGYEWNKNIGSDYEFNILNIIYGRNYSGKTTLSRIFKCLEDKKLHQDFENPNFSFILDDNTYITESNIISHSLEVCVYNTDFVKKHLSWLYNEDGTIQPFAVLGKENVEIEDKINTINNEIGDDPEKEIENPNKGLLYKLDKAKKEYKTKNKEFDSKKKKLEDKLKNKANNEIKQNPIYQNVNYNIRHIKSDIEKVIRDNITKLDSNEEGRLKKLVKENIKPNIKLLPEQKPNFQKYYEDTKTLLGKKIIPTQSIQELLNDSILQEWVRQGRELHENKRKTCAFCGNIIDDSLWEKLGAHFSKESEKLRENINSQIKDLEQRKNALDNFIGFNDENFYSIYQDEIRELLKQWKDLKSKYKNNIESLITQLKLRGKSIFKEIEIQQLDDVSNEILELIQQFNQIIAKHNDKTKTLENDQKKAREKLRLSEVSGFLEDIDYKTKTKEIEDLKQEVDGLESNKNETESKILELNEEKRKLETQLKDESRGAELINEYLEKHFGTNGFKLIPTDDTKGIKYKITRDEQEAKNLSEGECSLVAFCYFMAKIHDKLNDPLISNQLIIYIDDPISSLDNNHIFFVFSLIELVITKQKRYKQLFISTHNLDFLKYIKRLSSKGDPKKSMRYFIIEVEQKQNIKRSVLKKMPKHLKDYTTEFNYLFNEIYKLYKSVNGNRAKQIENTYNQFYNIPNNLRKFLEYYLFFKYPNTDTPLSNLDKLFEGHIPPLLNRLINERSHLTYIDGGWKPIDVPEIEECIKIVIDKIKEKDNEQFEALKSSIGILN